MYKRIYLKLKRKQCGGESDSQLYVHGVSDSQLLQASTVLCDMMQCPVRNVKAVRKIQTQEVAASFRQRKDTPVSDFQSDAFTESPVLDFIDSYVVEEIVEPDRVSGKPSCKFAVNSLLLLADLST